jgi:hypothetical protein
MAQNNILVCILIYIFLLKHSLYLPSEHSDIVTSRRQGRQDKNRIRG